MSEDRQRSETGRPEPSVTLPTRYAPPPLGTSSLLAAFAAGFVGVCALGVSVYEAYLMRQQQQAAVMPILEAWSSYGSESGFSINVANKGLGPAFLRSVSVTLDGQPKHDWIGVYQEVLGERPPGFSMSAVSGNVAAPGERVSMIAFSAGPEAGDIWRGSDRVGLTLCYCSVFDQCWEHRLEDVRSGVPRTEEVQGCRVDLDSNF